MRLVVFAVLCSSFIHLSANAQKRILIITGGHDFEKEAFFEMFNSFSGISYDTLVQPSGNEMIQNEEIKKYDALVFYDMFQEITDEQKAAYLKLLQVGKGMVFMHHSLVSYQNWPEFQKIIGGKYLLNETNLHPKSTYKHDVEIKVEIVDQNHPITKSMKDFQIHDEVYRSLIVNNDVTPLLRTDHPESTEVIGWYNNYKASKIVYLQLGHDHHAYENANFRKLVKNAINWVGSSQRP